MDIRSQLEAAGGAPAPDNEAVAKPVAESTVVEPTPTVAEPTKAASSESIATATEVMQAAAYQPNFKFKYTGKNGDKWGDAEGEFDEAIKAAIKTKEDEDKWQKLYSKAHGFEFVQEGREKARGELKQFQEQWSPIIDLAHKANKALTSGDMDAFFDHLGLSYDKVQAHVFNKLQMQDLQKQNPGQYQLMTQNQQATKQIQSYEEKLAAIQEENLQIQANLLQTELNQEYQKPEVSTFKQAYEAANGEGSFYQELQLRAKFIHDTQGRVARPGEVIGDVIKRFGFQAPTAQQTAPLQMQPPVQPQIVPATQKPTIPIMGGGGQSPTSKTFKSLKDIKAHRESL